MKHWWNPVVPATKKDIERIMSAISDFSAAMSAFFDRQDTAVVDIQGDVKGLLELVAKLQGTPGAITPEDQALLDGIQARAQAVSERLDALNALTPPVAPTP